MSFDNAGSLADQGRRRRPECPRLGMLAEPPLHTGWRQDSLDSLGQPPSARGTSLLERRLAQKAPRTCARNLSAQAGVMRICGQGSTVSPRDQIPGVRDINGIPRKNDSA